MKSHLATGLLAALALPAFGAAGADASSVEQKLMQMERESLEATIKNDVPTLEKFYADDWVGIDPAGKSTTKAKAMADLKAGEYKIQSAELNDVKVRVFGDTAVVTGGDTEKSTYKGKDSTGKYAWTDVWVMRQGHWQVAASQSTKIEK
jgi:ketosteroid isomerase-like protein